MLGAWSFLHVTDAVVGARFTASLAQTLASFGKRVLLFDLSPECPAIDFFLGVDDRVVYTLSDALRLPPCDVVLAPKDGLFFVPLGVGEAVDAACVSACVEAILPDIVLFFASRSTLSTARALSDGLVLLTDSSPVSLRAAAALCEGEALDAFLLSDFRETCERRETVVSLTEIADALGLPVFGVLPQIGAYNTPSVKEKNFTTAVKNMARRLMGESVPLLHGISMKRAYKKRFFTGISE